jgi:hypothetical protein
MVNVRVGIFVLALAALAACQGDTSAPVPRVAVVADGRVMFTDADIAAYDSTGLRFTLHDSALARLDVLWPYSLAVPRHKHMSPKSFAVLVDGDTAVAGRIQHMWSSYLPEGPLMDWPPLTGRLRIWAARAPGVPVTAVERIREALRQADLDRSR